MSYVIGRIVEDDAYAAPVGLTNEVANTDGRPERNSQSASPSIRGLVDPLWGGVGIRIKDHGQALIVECQRERNRENTMSLRVPA